MYRSTKFSSKRSMQSVILGAALCVFANAGAGEVSRAVFTTGIDNREPVSTVDNLDSSDLRSVSFFTELQDMAGQTVTHQWTHQDKVMFEKTFEVKADRWRVWTSKTLIPAWSGTWTVNVLDNDRSLLASKSLEYQ
jgi:hypothetical protein